MQKTKPSERRCYDVEMIRDFLDHLLWEIRISHSELSAPSIEAAAKSHPELEDQLGKFIKKRQTVALLANHAFSKELMLNGEVQRWREEAARIRDEQVRHLEALQGLFKEALRCASFPKVQHVLQMEDVDEVNKELHRMSGEFDN